MTSDSYDIDQAFDLLHELADIPFEDRESFYSPENVDHLHYLANDLLADESTSEIQSSQEFVQMSERLQEKEAYWSRTLGQTILEASDCRGRGDVIAAMFILDEFYNCCSSQAYREIVLAEMQSYKEE